MRPNFIFCSDPFTQKCDPDYKDEFNAALELDFSCSLISFEDILNNKIERAVSRSISCEHSIYRGWMLSVYNYNKLYQSLYERGTYLINNPSQYKYCHHFIENYAMIEKMTPRSMFLAKADINENNIRRILSTFGAAPAIIKDYVKSRKHEWFEACYMPIANNNDAFKVADTFIQRQGEDLQGGLVFREFFDLKSIGTHTKSKIPLFKEFRIFYWHHKPLAVIHYWDDIESKYNDDEYISSTVPLDKFNEIARSINSNFFTMDVAQCINNEWIIVELGDGQVAGLPNSVIKEFYKSFSCLRIGSIS